MSFPAILELGTNVNTGYKAGVIAIRKSKHEKMMDKVNGVTVYRVPEVALFKNSMSGKSRLRVKLYRIKSARGYIIEYFYFTFACLLLSAYLAIREGFEAIHIHNPPNTVFDIGAIYRLFGKSRGRRQKENQDGVIPYIIEQEENSKEYRRNWLD